MTPAERRERARIAANERWSKPGAREAQARASREALRRRLEDQVDPDRQMDPTELAQAVVNAVKLMTARARAAKTR